VTAQRSRVSRIGSERMNIPFPLRREILKIVVNEGVSEAEACRKIALTLESTQEAIQKEVRKQLVKNERSKVFDTLNKIARALSQKSLIGL